MKTARYANMAELLEHKEPIPGRYSFCGGECIEIDTFRNTLDFGCSDFDFYVSSFDNASGELHKVVFKGNEGDDGQDIVIIDTGAGATLLPSRLRPMLGFNGDHELAKIETVGNYLIVEVHEYEGREMTVGFRKGEQFAEAVLPGIMLFNSSPRFVNIYYLETFLEYVNKVVGGEDEPVAFKKCVYSFTGPQTVESRRVKVLRGMGAIKRNESVIALPDMKGFGDILEYSHLSGKVRTRVERRINNIEDGRISFSDIFFDSTRRPILQYNDIDFLLVGNDVQRSLEEAGLSVNLNLKEGVFSIREHDR